MKTIRLFFVAFAFLLIAFTFLARADDRFAACAEHLPFGAPEAKAKSTTPLCKQGYAALHDDELKVARWVAWRLTGKQTMGCEKRADDFHPEPLLPAEKRATPSDYLKSGYDRGHQAPAADFVHSKEQMRESFSLANMTPQEGKLNRGPWKTLEETTRAWAFERGELYVLTGPVMAERAGEKRKTVGKGKVGVPLGYWKLVVDAERKEAIGFYLPNRALPKQKLDHWQKSPLELAERLQMKLPLPAGIDPDLLSPLWRSDVAAWNKKRKQGCK